MERDVRYEVIEHTADVGIKAYGDGVNEIFENAALGMFDLMTDVTLVRPVGEVKVEVQAHDLGALLVDWLSELLFLHEVDHAFFAEFVVAVDGLALQGTARGEEVDPGRHRLEAQVKAVTYHKLEVNPEEGYATVIFDI
ncbi:MAG: archease [Thermoplasmata archaeon]